MNIQEYKHFLHTLMSRHNFLCVSSSNSIFPNAESVSVYKNWLKKGYAADMKYLISHLPIKENPQSLLPGARTLMVILHPYFPTAGSSATADTTTAASSATDTPAEADGAGSSEAHQTPLKYTRKAFYSQGGDYHYWFKKKLTLFAEDLHRLYPKDFWMVATDSAPIFERQWGVQTGLGWIGKNTCLIHPRFGSLFFIGEILSTAILPKITLQMIPENIRKLSNLPHPSSSERQDGEPLGALEDKVDPIKDFCGNCTKCIDICPTQALTFHADQHIRWLDSKKCISYLTIESKSLHPPQELIERQGDWFFGCDLCQSICPWNQKAHKVHADFLKSQCTHTLPLSNTNRNGLIQDLRWLLTTSNRQIRKTLYNSPLLRASPLGLKRNALIVAFHQNLGELQSEIESLAIQYPQLRELAHWCLNRLKRLTQDPLSKL